MHELSIAMSIIEGASREALNHGGAQVHTVYLKLGPLSGVVKDALLFSYSLACEGTLMKGSRLEIEEVPVVVFCPSCKVEKTLDSIQRFCCPDCGALTPDVISGRELQLVSIEISEGDSSEDPIEFAPPTKQWEEVAL
jgi:hydrogenase nickel incorporation protein HypA/HybF